MSANLPVSSTRCHTVHTPSRHKADTGCRPCPNLRASRGIDIGSSCLLRPRCCCSDQTCTRSWSGWRAALGCCRTARSCRRYPATAAFVPWDSACTALEQRLAASRQGSFGRPHCAVGGRQCRAPTAGTAHRTSCQRALQQSSGPPGTAHRWLRCGHHCRLCGSSAPRPIQAETMNSRPGCCRVRSRFGRRSRRRWPGRAGCGRPRCTWPQRRAL